MTAVVIALLCLFAPFLNAQSSSPSFAPTSAPFIAERVIGSYDKGEPRDDLPQIGGGLTLGVLIGIILLALSAYIICIMPNISCGKKKKIGDGPVDKV